MARFWNTFEVTLCSWVLFWLFRDDKESYIFWFLLDILEIWIYKIYLWLLCSKHSVGIGCGDMEEWKLKDPLENLDYIASSWNGETWSRFKIYFEIRPDWIFWWICLMNMEVERSWVILEQVDIYWCYISEWRYMFYDQGECIHQLCLPQQNTVDWV